MAKRGEFINIAGQRFGRLVIAELEPQRVKGRILWTAHCDCGVTRLVASSDVRTGAVQSCGCFRRDVSGVYGKARATKHGMRDTPEYRAWTAMKQRCTNPHMTNYHNYGARGISVCTRWMKSFDAFFADMGPRPSTGHSLDRINNEGNYEPANCRWATKHEQSMNRRNTGARVTARQT